jgi:hypothetical protein
VLGISLLESGRLPLALLPLPTPRRPTPITTTAEVPFALRLGAEGATTVRLIVWSNEPREEAEARRIAGGYREPSYVRTTVHEYVGSARDQCVTAFRQTAGKSYPSPDRNGRAISCTCSRTLACSSGGSDRRTREEDAEVSVR